MENDNLEISPKIWQLRNEKEPHTRRMRLFLKQFENPIIPNDGIRTTLERYALSFSRVSL